MIVIGVGNPDRGDDGAGPAVARGVRAALTEGGPRRAHHIRVLECGGEASALMDAWEGASAVIVIDAVRSGASPGYVHRIDAHRQAVPSRGAGSSTHALGVAEAVALARALGRLPARLILYGIEGKTFEAGACMSPQVSAAIPSAAARVLSEMIPPI